MDSKHTTSREVWIDWLRVAACFMVMIVHSTEPFYIGGEGARILTEGDAVWASFFDSFVRACVPLVPLFVVASSYLQFPLHYSTGEFFRRRLKRVIIPLNGSWDEVKMRPTPPYGHPSRQGGASGWRENENEK